MGTPQREDSGRGGTATVCDPQQRTCSGPPQALALQGGALVGAVGHSQHHPPRLAAAHDRRTAEVEHHPPQSRRGGAGADAQQPRGGHLQQQGAPGGAGRQAVGGQQGGEVDGHLVAQGALAIGSHHQPGTKPLELQLSATTTAATTHPQLALGHLQRQPQLPWGSV